MRDRGKVAGIISIFLLVIALALLLYRQTMMCGGIDGPVCSPSASDATAAGLATLFVGIFPGIFFLIELLNHN